MIQKYQTQTVPHHTAALHGPLSALSATRALSSGGGSGCSFSPEGIRLLPTRGSAVCTAPPRSGIIAGAYLTQHSLGRPGLTKAQRGNLAFKKNQIPCTFPALRQEGTGEAAPFQHEGTDFQWACCPNNTRLLLLLLLVPCASKQRMLVLQ